MAIGERIRYIRNLRNMTQKVLGMKLGFSEKTSEVRMTQYESGARTPKEKMIEDMAGILAVSPQALTIPDIESYIGLAHTFFTLEDLYGIKINKLDGELCITLDRESKSYHAMFAIFDAWQLEAAKLEAGEITKEEYNQWRYTYPTANAERKKVELDALRVGKDGSEKKQE